MNLTSGTNYTCTWNIFGVLEMTTAEGNLTHIFIADKIGRYNVTVCCANELTRDCKSVIQSVDEKILGKTWEFVQAHMYERRISLNCTKIFMVAL